MSENKIEIKKLNLEGLKILQDIYEENFILRKEIKVSDISMPEILEDSNFTESISSKVVIEKDKDFANRFEVAKYLHKKLNNVLNDDEFNDQGLWAWLALLYFEKLARQDAGFRRIEHYIPISSGSSGHNKIIPNGFDPTISLEYRHCIKGPYNMYDLLGEKSKFLTSKRLDSMGDPTENFASKKWLTTHKIIFEAFHDIFADENGFFKPGKFGKHCPKTNPKSLGNAFRSFLVTDGLLFTHNFHKMKKSSELIEIMGKEFEDSA